MLSDLRQAWRMIWRMPGLAAVVDRLARRRHRREHRGVLLDPADGAAADPRRRRRRRRAAGRAARRHRLVSRRVVARVSRPARSHAARLPDLFAFRMVPFNVGEPGRPERGHGLLVSGNYFSALGLRPALGRFLRAGRSGAARRRAGRRHLPRVLADALRRRADRARTDAARERPAADDRRRRARALPGHGHDAGLRSLGAGDDGAGAARRIARARGPRPARLLRGRPAGAAREPRRGADRARRRRCAQLAHDYPETQQRRCTAEVLPFWQAPRGPQQFLSARWRSCRASCCSCCSRSAATPPT